MQATASFKIKVIKNQIAACLREIEKGVRSFVVRLLDLEQELDSVMNHLSEKAQKIKARLLEGLAKGYSAESKKFQALALEAAEKCNDSKVWEKWGYDLLSSDWRNNGDLEILSQKLRTYAKKSEETPDPIDRIISDLEDNGISVNRWENYGKKRLYLHDQFGESCGYVDITSKPISKATGDVINLVEAIVNGNN